MKIKLIASDIDGTLVRGDKTISTKTYNYLTEFKQKGGTVVLATGRAYLSTRKVMDKLGLSGIVITYNGAKIVNTETDEVIFYLPVEEKHGRVLVSIAKKYDVHLNLYQGDDLVVENSQRPEALRYAENCQVTPVQKDFDTLESYETIKTVFIGAPEKLKLIENDIVEALGDELYITYSNPTYLEVLNKNVNKGMALKKVLEHFNISPEQVAAFGDELNDKEMLTSVKYGVVMGNGNPKLKELVQHETLSNDEDGIVAFMEKFVI